MNQNLTTCYLLILDRSGSMNHILEPIRSALNEQFGQIKSLQRQFPEQTFLVSLLTFNESATHVFRNLPALELRDLMPHEYQPNGMTALYDAIGTGVSALRDTHGSDIRSGKASAVVSVFTDGYENASREYSHQQISKLIQQLDVEPNWTFSFVGATPDAVEIAISLHIRHSNAITIDPKLMANHARMESSRLISYASEKRKGKVAKDFLGKIDVNPYKHREHTGKFPTDSN